MHTVCGLSNIHQQKVCVTVFIQPNVSVSVVHLLLHVPGFTTSCCASWTLVPSCGGTRVLYTVAAAAEDLEVSCCLCLCVGHGFDLLTPLHHLQLRHTQTQLVSYCLHVDKRTHYPFPFPNTMSLFYVTFWTQRATGCLSKIYMHHLSGKYVTMLL